MPSAGPIPTPSPSPSSDPQPLVDPRITRSLGADYEALKNDLDQANEFAGELQKELAVNRNDAAFFKQLFEKTRLDLERMQQSILALRHERHHLANEVMKARCFEVRVKAVTEERDALATSLAQSQKSAAEALATIEKRDVQVAELTMQVMLLKNTFRQTQQMRVAEIAAKRVEEDFIERFER